MQQRPRKKVCIQCRRAHTACDGQQPCRRCIGAGIADQCCPPPPGKPRGRYMTGGLAGAGGATVGAAAGAPLQMPNVGMPALAPHVMPAQTTFASAFASSADPSAGAGAGLADPYAQPQAKKQRSEPDGGATAGMMGMPHMLYGGAQGGTTTSTSTSTAAELSQIKSLMSMLIEQVRDVKRETADLREEVLDMRMRLDDNDAIHKRHMDELRREVTAAGLKGPRKGRRSHDSSSALSLSTTTLANSGGTTANVLESALQRQAIMTTLPFVREYSEHLDSFVLNDVMTDAFAVFYMGEPKSVEELSVNPPVFVHASPACCALTGFTQEELMGKPIFMLCQTEKEMIFVILTRIFSKPTKPTGEIFVTTMTWATKDKRALVVRLRHQIFYNKQRQPKWYFVAVESVLDDDAPEPQRSLSDILHNPSELQRFKSQFSAFFDSLYTTKTVTTTVTTLHHHAGPGAHALMGSSIPAAFPPSSTTTFSAFPAISHHFPHAVIGAAQYYQPPQLGPASSEDYSPTSGSMSGSSSFDSSSPESNPLDPATTSSSSSSASSSTLSSSAQAWSNITLAELLEDDECRAILQEQKRKAAESHQLQLQQQQQQQQQINQRVNLASGSGGGSGKSLADQSLEELLDEFVPRTAQPS